MVIRIKTPQIPFHVEQKWLPPMLLGPVPKDWASINLDRDVYHPEPPIPVSISLSGVRT